MRALKTVKTELKHGMSQWLTIKQVIYHPANIQLKLNGTLWYFQAGASGAWLKTQEKLLEFFILRLVYCQHRKMLQKLNCWPNETQEQNPPPSPRYLPTGGGQWVGKRFFCEVHVYNYGTHILTKNGRWWHKVPRQDALKVWSQQLSKECCCFTRLTQSCAAARLSLKITFIWTCAESAAPRWNQWFTPSSRWVAVFSAWPKMTGMSDKCKNGTKKY